MKFEKIVQFTPAFDKRHPDPSRNYGIGSVRIRFILKGEKGAVQFYCSTKWYLPETIKEYRNSKGVELLDNKEEDCSGISAWDLGYHSPKPMFKGQTSDACDILEKGECYYDGSGLNAFPLAETLVREGSDGIWKKLEEYYESVYGENRGGLDGNGFQGDKRVRGVKAEA